MSSRQRRVRNPASLVTRQEVVEGVDAAVVLGNVAREKATHHHGQTMRV
jgi:hypothetical protein